MGREIRRVPLDWQHPKTWDGTYQPLYDEPYKAVLDAWVQGYLEWEAGTHHKRAEYPDSDYWEYEGPPPDPDYYRPAWEPNEVLGWAYYETTTEGTPLSPTFASADLLKAWLISEGGYSAEGADYLLERGAVPTGMVIASSTATTVIDAVGIANRLGRLDESKGDGCDEQD